ncbi:unnamed protein product [Wickerhamomyces anomalus]
MDLLNTTPLQLFQTKSLPEIQDLSSQLSSISIRKHDEIRNLVGSKYRDLLISADEIKKMETLAYQEDKQLYDLVFNAGGKRLDERNVERFFTKEEKKVGGFNHVLENSEFFIKLSKFLKIDQDYSFDKIYDIINELGNSWGNGKDRVVILEKFKQVEIILFNKVDNIDDIEELFKLRNFINGNVNFNLNKFDERLFGKILKLIKIDEFIDLKLILIKFPNFQNELKQTFANEIIGNLETNESLINELHDPNDTLKLYELKFDQDYLTNIDYLSKGLINKQYQNISDFFNKIGKNLNYLKLIINPNNDEFKQFELKYNQVLQKFKNHAEFENNKLLVKYLNKIS